MSFCIQIKVDFHESVLIVSDSSCPSINTILQLCWLHVGPLCRSWTSVPLGVSVHNVIAPAAPSSCFSSDHTQTQLVAEEENKGSQIKQKTNSRDGIQKHPTPIFSSVVINTSVTLWTESVLMSVHQNIFLSLSSSRDGWMMTSCVSSSIASPKLLPNESRNQPDLIETRARTFKLLWKLILDQKLTVRDELLFSYSFFIRIFLLLGSFIRKLFHIWCS